MSQRILIVDDEALIRKSLGRALVKRGYEVDTAASGAEALEVFAPDQYALVLLDLRLPDTTGIDLLKKFKELQTDLLVIMMTAFGSVETAVEAMRLGAYDYINKPFKTREIEVIIRLALDTGDLRREVRRLREDASKPYGLQIMKSEDPAMLKVFDTIRKVVATPEVPVLITGESGTGKEMVARAIHAESDHFDKPFEAINCAAIPTNLLESELFGHEKGAFTDAKERKEGLFERGQGGTVFLDEIGDMDPALQAKLLRVVEGRQVRRIGGSEQIPLNIRLIAATNQNLEKLIAEGRFREDLYYRLRLINIELPPLRERPGDIEPLSRHFIQGANERFHKQVQGLTPEALTSLCAYRWPGNVRELKNTIERILILEETELIDASHLPAELFRQGYDDKKSTSYPGAGKIEQGLSLEGELDHLSEHLIREALKLSKGNKAKAARLLSMDRGTLRYNMKRLGIEH